LSAAARRKILIGGGGVAWGGVARREVL